MSKYQQIPVPPYPGEREPGKESLVKVAALQMEPHIGDKDHNVAASLKMIDEAGALGVKLMVLPELCNTGYINHFKACGYVMVLVSNMGFHLKSCNLNETFFSRLSFAGIWGDGYLLVL